MRATKRKRCAQCDEWFEANRSKPSWQKYCSPACQYAAARERAAAKNPPREEIERLYVEERLSDVEIGQRFGRSNQWAFSLRRRYGIAGREGGDRYRGARNPNARPSRSQWSLKLKGDTRCRSCGGQAVHLHHIVPRSKTRRGRLNVEGNGMPLCFDCHRGWHDGRLLIFRDRLKPEELEWAIEHAGPLWVEMKYPYRPDHALRRLRALKRGEDPEAVEAGGTEEESLGIARMVNEGLGER